MTKHYKKEEMDFSSGKPICPDCKDHKQGDTMEFFDCKNTYGRMTLNGRYEIAGQCCCYSIEHGKKDISGEKHE